MIVVPKAAVESLGVVDRPTTCHQKLQEVQKFQQVSQNFYGVAIAVPAPIVYLVLVSGGTKMVLTRLPDRGH